MHRYASRRQCLHRRIGFTWATASVWAVLRVVHLTQGRSLKARTPFWKLLSTCLSEPMPCAGCARASEAGRGSARWPDWKKGCPTLVFRLLLARDSLPQVPAWMNLAAQPGQEQPQAPHAARASGLPTVRHARRVWQPCMPMRANSCVEPNAGSALHAHVR